MFLCCIGHRIDSWKLSMCMTPKMQSLSRARKSTDNGGNEKLYLVKRPKSHGYEWQLTHMGIRVDLCIRWAGKPIRHIRDEAAVFAVISGVPWSSGYRRCRQRGCGGSGGGGWSVGTSPAIALAASTTVSFRGSAKAPLATAETT